MFGLKKKKKRKAKKRESERVKKKRGEIYHFEKIVAIKTHFRNF